MKKLLASLSLIMLIGLLAACSNTAQGAGRDVKNMGQWMQDTF
jgi:predicted small secreted protein